MAKEVSRETVIRALGLSPWLCDRSMNGLVATWTEISKDLQVSHSELKQRF